MLSFFIAYSMTRKHLCHTLRRICVTTTPEVVFEKAQDGGQQGLGITDELVQEIRIILQFLHFCGFEYRHGGHWCGRIESMHS